MPIELVIGLAIPILLIVIGRVVGARVERRHLDDIAEREAKFAKQPAFSSNPPEHTRAIRHADLARGSVVISVDYFKRFIGGLRMMIGGEVRSYSTLIERARREALLRMKESRPDADAYVNTRLETSTISSTGGDEGMGTIEVLAYGTAVHYDPTP